MTPRHEMQSCRNERRRQENVNVRAAGMLLLDVHVNEAFGGESRAAQDPANKSFGIGVSTPREMVTLLERLERGGVVNPTASKEMIDLLKRQQSHNGIGRTLNGIVEMASKPGALDHLRSDVGIIYAKQGRVAMAITCDDIPAIDWTDDNPGYLLMSLLSLILIEGLGK